MKSNKLFLSDSKYHKDHQMVDFISNIASYHLQSPHCAFALIDAEAITETVVTQFLTKIIKDQLPSNIQGLSLTLRAENISSDYYHYTHGLKLHDGNCQRIAHGHRSKIQIFKNNQRDAALEKSWCQRWKDIYIASEADRIIKDKIQLSDKATQYLTPDHQYFSYIAPQGRFDIAVSSNVLDVVDCDSTVELLADFILRKLKASNNELAQSTVKVIAYEGVAKGAIVHG